MVSFEIFVKAMPPSLSELKVLPSFCFAFKIPDDRAITNNHNFLFFFKNEVVHSLSDQKYILGCMPTDMPIQSTTF